MKYSVNQLKKHWVTTKGIALEDFLVLALHILQKNRTEFFRESDHMLSPEQYTQLTNLLERRSRHEPVAYLLGTKEFFGRDFLVNRHTLIPRPDSECLVEDVLSFGQNNQQPDYIFDIGTGSGALAITLRKELNDTSLQIVASDISSEVLLVAKENAAFNKAEVSFLQGSLLEPYQKIIEDDPQYTYIIANLPYVSEELLQNTAPDVQNYEPKSALLSGDQGLAHYIQLFNEMKKCDSLHGFCWLEISPEQSDLLTEKIKHILPAAEIFIGQDLSQRDRFIRFSF